MATFYSAELAGIVSTPVVKPDATKGHAARVRRFRGTVTLATQTTSDNLALAQLPAGSTFAFGVLTSSISLGASTLAIGIAGTTGKYRAAATFTAVDVPTPFGIATQVGNQTPLAAEELILGTIAAASLPASGTLVVDMYASNG